MDQKIEKWAAERAGRELDRMMAETMTGTVTNVPTLPPLTPAALSKMFEDWRKLIFNARRNDLTFIVSLSHVGPVLQHDEPCSGTFWEMSFAHAQALHAEWPLVLAEIIDEHTAHFRPAHKWDQFVPRILPMPPYELPETECTE